MSKVVLILGNGSWDKIELLPDLAATAACTIAADGGFAKTRRLGIRVDLVIGDLDSLNSEEQAVLKKSGTETITYPAEKDRTDLELALDYAISLEPQKIVLFGVLGGRLDQSLANIFLLEKAARRGIASEIVAGAEQIYLVHDRLELAAAAPGDLVSLIPLSAEVRGVQTWGLKYGLQRERLYRASSRGVSNKVVALPAGVELTKGLLLVIHRG
ncbi:MAG: thiamine diphosphokinase [Candidatus Bipolaricaulota bacterium]|nr:thiamine diphosphokinase [Candidatus Bipolaricaulota bacterium]